MKTIAPMATMATPTTSRGSGGSLRRSRRLIAPPSRRVEQRAQRDRRADEDQQQRPRIAVGQSELVQLHQLQPPADRDQPEARPERAEAEKFQDADHHDEHRPPGADD